MGEELFKVIAFLIAMFLIYRITKNRKVSMIIGVLAALLAFGALHYYSYSGNWPQIIFIIGIGSLFYFYAYLKTKNVMVSYIVHLLIDGIIFVCAILAGMF